MFLKAIGIIVWGFHLVGCSPIKSEVRSPDTQHVIYGEDSREDLNSVQLNPTRASAILIQNQFLKPLANGLIEFRKFPLKKAYPLCANEKFQDQIVLGHCSGTLIGPRHVLTAGHCFRNLVECQKMSFVFAWTLEKSLLGFFKPSEAYSCQKIRAHENRALKWDYAVVELDRDVTQAKPVVIASADQLKEGDRVVSLSYPFGLPLKSDVGSIFRRNTDSPFLEVAVDTFRGSSGSGLFNSQGQLIGVLSTGSEDFLEEDIERVQRSGGCIQIKRCDVSPCWGERFFKASRVPKFSVSE